MVLKSSATFVQEVLKVATNEIPLVKPSLRFRLPPLPSPGDLLKLYNIRAQRQLSQNFLLDKHLIGKIIRKTGDIKDCYVCEVGPGPGNITRSILEYGAKHVTVIEKDRRFIPSLELLADACNGRLKIMIGDIMDLSLENIFPKEFAQDWKVYSPPFYIIGNLPFNVSTPLIIKWLQHAANHTGPFTHGRTKLALTFQKEVAQRMVADPGSDMRCRLSIMCQYLCSVSHKFTIPGRAFFPKPEVDVGVVKFTPLIRPYIQQPFSLVEKVMRNVFHHRQKNLKFGIELLFPSNREDLVEELFNLTKISTKKKPYNLEMAELSMICDVYSEMCKKNDGLIDFDYRASKATQKFYSLDSKI